MDDTGPGPPAGLGRAPDYGAACGAPMESEAQRAGWRPIPTAERRYCRPSSLRQHPAGRTRARRIRRPISRPRAALPAARPLLRSWPGAEARKRFGTARPRYQPLRRRAFPTLLAILHTCSPSPVTDSTEGLPGAWTYRYRSAERRECAAFFGASMTVLAHASDTAMVRLPHHAQIVLNMVRQHP